MKEYFEDLERKAAWVRRESLRLHLLQPESRIASSLSVVEVFTVLYYGDILRYQGGNPTWPERDRMVLSKGHGCLSLYPILADRGFFPREDLDRFGQEGSFLGILADSRVPGLDLAFGSLGHGPAAGCGIALALLGKGPTVFVVVGDGELAEGSVWEAVSFAGAQALSNLILVVDRNEKGMLGYCYLPLLEERFRSCGWRVKSGDGHKVREVWGALQALKESGGSQPRVFIANTVKGKGVRVLEEDPLCHVRSLTRGEVEIAGGF